MSLKANKFEIEGHFFVKKQSLHQIMNDMVQRLDRLQPQEPKKRAPAPLSELEAFMQMDGLLASLNKDYLEAKSQRRELAALYGDEDAMAEVAMDMEDSAWCAMQTRYLELRAERELMERAQRLMRGVEEKIEEEKAKDKVLEAQQLAYSVRVVEQLRAKERRVTIGAFEALFVLMIFKLIPSHQAPSFNQRGLAA